MEGRWIRGKKNREITDKTKENQGVYSTTGLGANEKGTPKKSPWSVVIKWRLCMCFERLREAKNNQITAASVSLLWPVCDARVRALEKHWKGGVSNDARAVVTSEVTVNGVSRTDSVCVSTLCGGTLNSQKKMPQIC